MNKLTKIQVVFFLSTIFFGISFAQNLPDYPERSFRLKLDSLQAAQNFASTVATEGSIDPAEYYVGPGDKIFISISGVKEIIHNLTLNQEGWLYIPQVGGIDLNQLTLKEAKEKISKAINRYYKNVSIFISLIDFRMIRVSLVGDVVKTKSYTIPANARLSDLISISNGLTKTSNMRNIKIIPKEGDPKVCDLLAFLRFGNYDQNPMLREGDVVVVDVVDKTVQISGLIKYPAKYEFVEGETVYNLIQLAGGFLTRAKRDTIEVVRFFDDGELQKSEYYSYDYIKENNIFLQNMDHVIIRQIPEYYIDYFVKIAGYVKYPGFYRIAKDKTTLKGIIEKAGCFLDEASLTEATLTRKIDNEEKDLEFNRLKLMEPKDMTQDEYAYFKARSRERSGRVVVNFVRLFKQNDKKENIVLRKGDVITIPERKNYITMLGQIINPGNIIYDSSYTVDDYINLAGGFGWHAEEGEVRVIKAKTGEWIYPEDVESLEPGDAIWVPEEPPAPEFWEIFNTTLQVLGQVAAVVAATAAIIIATR